MNLWCLQFVIKEGKVDRVIPFVEKMALTAYFICSQLTAQFTDLETICELICTFENDGHITGKSVQYDFILNKFPYEIMN